MIFFAPYYANFHYFCYRIKIRIGMRFIKTDIEGVTIVESIRFEDERGWFSESFSQREFSENVCDTAFVQDNEAWSRRGVVRGLHYQMPPYAQAKLVRAVRGTIIDVAVDIRRGSPTFGKHVAVELSSENGRQLFIPRGFAHGYSVMGEEALIAYKCDAFWAPEAEGGIRFDDPQLRIDWRLDPREMIVSARDRELPTLENAKLFDYNQLLG